MKFTTSKFNNLNNYYDELGRIVQEFRDEYEESENKTEFVEQNIDDLFHLLSTLKDSCHTLEDEIYRKMDGNYVAVVQIVVECDNSSRLMTLRPIVGRSLKEMVDKLQAYYQSIDGDIENDQTLADYREAWNSEHYTGKEVYVHPQACVRFYRGYNNPSQSTLDDPFMFQYVSAMEDLDDQLIVQLNYMMHDLFSRQEQLDIC